MLLQVSGELEGIGRMLACYAATTRARLSRPVPQRPRSGAHRRAARNVSPVTLDVV